MESLKHTAGYVRSLWIVFPLALAVTAIGCGGGSEKGLVPVSGVVTLDGGPWPKEGQIIFSPVAQSASNSAEFRPGVGKFGTDGNFSVTSYQENDGLYPGTYKVAVACWAEPPGMDANGRMVGKNAVPEKYQQGDTSGLTFEVKPGQTKKATFDVKSK